jgi:hypothetical protein
MTITSAGKISAVLALFMALMSQPASAALHSGSYHSVASKSSWSNGKFPANFSLTINVEFKDNKLIYHSVNDHAPQANLDYTAPLDGTVMPMLNNKRFNQVSVKKIGPGQLEILEMKDGDVLVGSYWDFSADGKTFVRRGIGKGADGKSHEFEEFYQLK